MKLATTIILSVFVCASSSAHPSYGLEADSKGNFYFADISKNGRGTVWKLTNSGKLIVLLKDFHAHSVKVDHEDNLWVANGEDHHYLLKVSPSGKMDTVVSTRDFNHFFGGNCTITSNGEVVFGINKQIYRWTSDGPELYSDLKLGWNNMLYGDNLGNVYVNDLELDDGSLFRVKPGGEYQLLASNLIDKSDGYDRHSDIILGVGTDSQGSVYLADMGGRRIIKISEGGKTSDIYTASGPWTPTGVTFHKGIPYILEFTDKLAGPRITLIKSNGESEVFFDYERYKKGSIGAPGSPSKNRGMPVFFSLLVALLMFTAVLIYAKYQVIFRK